MTERISNYDIMKKRMEPEFLKYDQAVMIEKFNLKNDENYIYLTLFDREYRVDRKSGVVLTGEKEADFNAAMTIYDLLCYSKPGCAPSGELVNMNSLSTLHSSSVTLGGGIFSKAAEGYAGKSTELERACVKLGGEKYGRGDVAYKIPMFCGVYLGIAFWEADEEFPPSLTLLADKNLLWFMHFETMWYAMSLMLDMIEQNM